MTPVLARGDAWRSAKWATWPGPLGDHPSTADALAWVARAGWCVALVAALLAVPFIVRRMTLGADDRVPRLGVPTIAPLVLGPRGWRTPLRDVPGVLRGAALVLAALALGRPQSVLRGETQEERGIDIVIVLDLSGSMSAVMDAPAAPGGAAARGAHHRPTRIDVAKDVLIDFVRRRKTDRIGVVVFAKQAFVLSPPTLDYALITQLVSKIELGVIDSSKTAIGDAVGTAVARVRRSDARSKAVVLLTDGDSNEGVISPEYAAHLAQKEGVRIYTVQIGNGDDVDVQTGTDLFGQPVYQRQHFPVNPELLRKIPTRRAARRSSPPTSPGSRRACTPSSTTSRRRSSRRRPRRWRTCFRLLLLPAAVLVALEALVRLALVRRFP